MIATKHLTDSSRNVISCTGDSVVVEPEGAPKAVFKRPLTILQISDGIKIVLIHFTKDLQQENRSEIVAKTK